MILNLENNLLRNTRSAPALVEESCLANTFGAKVFSNQGIDLTVAAAQQFKRFIAAGKV